MKRTTVCIFILVWMFTAKAHARDAMFYFNQGLEGEVTNRKIYYFTKALSLNPKLADAYERRGMLYYYLEKYDAMINDFQAYVEFVPTKAKTYCMLGLGHLKAGHFKTAIAILTRAIEIDANLADAYAHRAEAYRMSGQYEQAIQDATRTIDMWSNPLTMSDALKTRAKVFWEVGRNTEAYADNKRSYYMDPRIPKLWTTFTPVENMRGMGLLYLIAIAFALVFRLKLKPPSKRE